jgi:hypothetical protein
MAPRTDAELQAKWDAMPGPWVKRKRGMFYRPNNQGYTAYIAEAGFWPKDEAKAYAAESWGEVTAAPAAAYREDMVAARDGAIAAIEKLDAAIAATN